MAITRTAWTDDDGTGTTGTIVNNAEKTLLYNQIDEALGGVWVDVPFNASHFAATGGTWTVSSFTTFAYTVSGKTMIVAFYTSGSATVGGTPSSLSILIPGGYIGARSITTTFSYSAAGAAGVGWGLAQSAQPTILLYRDILGTAWPTGSMSLTGTFIFKIT